ncbi:MAG: endonuclease/exonuclease/phosphatase family protein, partial [bacterium]
MEGEMISAKSVYVSMVSVIVVMVAMCCTGCGNNSVNNRNNESGILKVMTINVWSGLDYEGTLSMGEYEAKERRIKRYRALLENIHRVSPDVIAVNEANYLPDYVEKLAEDLDYDYIYHVGIAGLKVFRLGIPWNLKEGDAILARKTLGLEKIGRKQLSGGGFIWNNLSFHTSDATQVLVGKIKWNSKPVYLAVTHWHASPENTRRNKKLLRKLKERWNYSDAEYNEAVISLERDNGWRMDESEIMSAYLETVVPPGKPVILMGDFNASIDSPEVQYLLNRGYFDCFS